MCTPSTSRPHSRWRVGVALSALVTALVGGCGAAPEVVPATPASPEPTASHTGPGLAVLGYLDNFIVRTERGDWTPDVGIEQSLRMLVGLAALPDVVLQRPVGSGDLTGLIATGMESVDGIEHRGQRDHVQRILDMLVFDGEQLESMALDPRLPAPTRPPRPTPSGPLPTVGSQDVETEPPIVLPTLETDCQRFFRQFQVGNVERCLATRQRTASSSAYTVYSPASSLASFGWQESDHRLLDEAMDESMAVYEELGTMPPVTIVLAVNLNVPGDAATVMDADGCRIMVYTDAQRRSDTQFKQVIAQQLGHCLQAGTFPDQQQVPYVARRWREDGLAAYLGSLVYPDADVENEAFGPLITIGETSSLLHWSAAAVAWWQYVANDRGWDGIRAMVQALPDDGGVQEQARGLARMPGVDELFIGFAEQYVDGSIPDGGNSTLPTAWVPSAEEEGAAVDAAGPIFNEVLEPFSLGRHLLVVPGNLRAELDTSGGDGIEVRTRPLSGGDWGPLPSAFPADCASDVRLAIVVTSVGAESRDMEVSVDDVTPSGC